MMENSTIYSLETSLLPHKVISQREDDLVEQHASEVEFFSMSSVILPFLFPALGGLLFGYDIGATSGASISLQSAELSGTTWFNLSAVQQGLVAMHAAPLYIAETCPSQIRGTLISLKELLVVLGILLGYFVGSFKINVVGGWRYMFGMSVPFASVMGLGMLSLPPSPHWLLLRAVQCEGSLPEYKERAIASLSRLRGKHVDDKVSKQNIEDTIVSVKAAYQDQEASFLEVFQGPNLRAFIIGGGLVLFQQITGQPSVLYYAGQILQKAGFSAASDATRVSVLIGLFKFMMTGVAVLKVDDIGRKPLLIGGVSGIAISMFVLAAYYKFLGGLSSVAVGALLIYVGSYQISFGPISWLMVSEIFPLRTRGRGISLAVLTNFGSNALVTFAYSPLKELLGAGNLFLVFGAIALLSLVFVLTLVPETKGLSLEEIEAKLAESNLIHMLQDENCIKPFMYNTILN